MVSTRDNLDMKPDLLRILDLAERLGQLAQSHLKSVAGASGLQPVHVRILLFVTAANRYSNTPQAVAEYLGLTKGTISQSLILLERKGLILREGDARDRRLVRLRPTAAGEEVARCAREAGAERWKRPAEALPDGLLDCLTEMLRRLQAQEGRRSFGLCRTCRHHLSEGPGQWRCALTGEPLTADDGEKICREHKNREVVGA